MSEDAKTLIDHYDFLWSKQGNFRSLWQTVAQYVRPAWDNFIGEWAEGVNRNTRLFDSTPSIANERFGAAMEAMLTPRSQRWHKLVAADEELNDNPAVQRWCDTVTKILFAARYHYDANFASQTDECYLDLGAFGNNTLFIDEVAGHSLRYRAWPLSEIVWALNHQGQVDTIYRKFKFTAKQAMQQWGKAVPASVQAVYARTPYEEIEWLHCVRPNEDYSPGTYGDRGKRFASWYIHVQSRSVVERGCYRTWPLAIGRYRVAPRESYGRGPAVACLPDIRTANEMVKTGLRIGQKAADPPILLAEESVLTNFNQRPGANNYGMLTSDGKPLAQPFEAKGNFEVSHEMLEQTRSVVRDTFLNTLFQILVQNPNMTATEALLRAQEKGELIAPAMGRQQSEFLGPMIRRELDVLHEAGQLPPPPMELLRSGKGITVEYTSPLARALKAEEGSAIMNTVQDMGVMAQLDPSVKTLMDLHEALREMAEIRGCPAKILRSEEEVDQIMQHQAYEQQQAGALAAAQPVSASALNLAKAAQAAGSVGTGAPGAPSVPQ